MSFANLFTKLSAINEDVRSPCESALPYRTPGEPKEHAKSGRKRKIWGEQHGGSNTKRKRHKEKATAQTNTTVTCYDPKFSKGYDSNAQDYHIETSIRERTSTGFTKEQDLCSHSGKSDRNKANNNKTKNNHNVTKQQQPKKKKNQNWKGERGRPGDRRGYHQSSCTPDQRRGRSANRGGKQSVPVERKRLMTAEFKEQNAFVVDGRFLCRHFLWGRCIKGDDCQLEHVQGYNNLIKEACKFYIQGFCTKGESCPYMHNSFPCKFFHVRGKCAQGDECKFSHEPLTTLTKELLEGALKRDNELAKKAEEQASGQPNTTEESKLTEENVTFDNAKPDMLMYPIRPMFYNSSCPSEPRDEKETFVCQADVTDDAVVPHATDAAQSHSPPSDLIHKESVSYSVEAVLGSQRAKPFPSLFGTHASQEPTAVSTPQSSHDCPSGFSDQSDAPYSVDAVLGFTKAACNHSSTPPSARSIDYTPKPSSSSTNQNEEVSHLLNVASESNKSLEKTFRNLSSSQAHASQISNFNLSAKTCTDLHAEQGRVNPESQKPALRASHMVKLHLLPPMELREKFVSSQTKADVKGAPGFQTSPHLPTKGNRQLPRDMTSLQDTTESQKPRDTALGSEVSKSKGVLPFGPTKPTRRAFHSLFSTPPSQASAPEHPTQLKSHLSCASSGSQDSTQSPHPPSGVTDSTVKAAVSAETVTSNKKNSVFVNSVTHQFVPKQPTDSKHHPLGAPSGLKGGTQPRDCTETTMNRHSKTVHGVDSAGECSRTIKRPFHKLFASPITDCFVQLPCSQDTPDSVMSPTFPQDSFQSSRPATSSADCRGEDIPVETAPETSKATVRSFRSLFASPISELTADPLLCIQSQPDPPTSSSPQEPDQSADSASGCKQRASDLETTSPQGLFSVSVHTGSPAVPTSPDVPTGQKGENGHGSHTAKCVNPSPNPSVNPACSLMSDSASDTVPACSDASLEASIAQTQVQLPDVSSHKGSSEGTIAHSVLKTLFVSLSPYQQDVEQQGNIDISVPLEIKNKHKSSTECVFPEEKLMRLKQQNINEVERIKEEPKEEKVDPHRQLKGSCKQTAEKTVAHPGPGEHQPPLQNCQIPLETRGGSNSSSPGTSQAQVRASGIHNLPITPMASLTQPSTRLPLKQTSGQKCVKGKVGLTSLKDLFKSLNPTASPFGH